MTTLRSCVLYCLRTVGVFGLARYLTRKQLRILCYHGFSIGDEHEVSPGMFMRAETFEQRMQILRKRRIPVITLDEAVRRLPRGEITNAETVITLDDGWASNLSIGAQILERYGYPACIYISTEHLEAGTEAFNVALSYMIRRSGREALTLEGLHPLIDGTYDIHTDPDAAIVDLILRTERAFPLAERQRLLRPIACALGTDLDKVLSGGRFHLLSRDQIREAHRRGLDIQLHSHTHHLSDTDFDATAWDTNTNRRWIRELTGAEPRHFCYPSGDYGAQHPEWLRKLGIASATTCNPGFNDASTSVMLLNRLLDSERKSNLIFEAEVCGLRELPRYLLPNSIRKLPRLLREALA
jgi:peptidoglycan/xylan/chitin deacetylase (PgdA/CDA1 family)